MRVKALVTNVSKKFGVVRLRRLNRPDDTLIDVPLEEFDWKIPKGVEGGELRGGRVMLVSPRIFV